MNLHEANKKLSSIVGELAEKKSKGRGAKYVNAGPALKRLIDMDHSLKAISSGLSFLQGTKEWNEFNDRMNALKKARFEALIYALLALQRKTGGPPLSPGEIRKLAKQREINVVDKVLYPDWPEDWDHP